ncbi:MAG: carbohydrate ABC transporter permease [Bacillota bacterium]|nr:carbohydrate ABC transporter permease [Bacillota bacterium]
MNKIKRTTGEWIFTIFNYIFLSFLSLICLYPILYVLFASVSDPIGLQKQSGLLFAPIFPMTMGGYQLVMQNPNVGTGYMNTLIYVIGGTTLNLAFTALGAYVLSRQQFLWRNVLMAILTFTMFFSGGMIPSFLLVRSLGIYNTRWAIILPGLVSTYNLIIMRTAFSAVPESLEESAKLDGAGHFRIFAQIMLPLTKATIAVLVLYYAVGHWNAWFNAAIYLEDQNKWPLQLTLRQILLANKMSDMTGDMTQTGGEADLVYAARELVQYCTIIVATVPILCVYPFIQKHFVKGVMIGSVKG